MYQATACATYTTAGAKAILEPKISDDLYELLPNYAFRTGVDVSWRTSNWGEPPIHIDEYLTNEELGTRYPGENIYYDGILLKGLRERIASSNKNKVLIILHTSTSHGPKYSNKYPQEFEVYKPVAQNVEEGQKNIGMLVNAYDNTIRYTDFLVDSLINTLRAMEDWHSAMIFISDHGESLGENKMFMHGLPMKLAPKEQYEIPFLVWTSEGFRDYKSDLPAVLEQHYIFHSVLNLLSIQSPAYNQDYDIFKTKPRDQRTVPSDSSCFSPKTEEGQEHTGSLHRRAELSVTTVTPLLESQKTTENLDFSDILLIFAPYFQT